VKRYLLVMDAGTGSARCFIVDADGSQCWTEKKEWSYFRPEDAAVKGLEFVAQSHWKILAKVARDVIKRSGIEPSQIAAVSATSLREGNVLLDEAGTELFAAPQHDRRGDELATGIEARFGERIYRSSGHWPTGIFAPARLTWLKQHRPEMFAKAETLLMINDWIAYRLTGVRCSEPTNAAETCLFDIHAQKWDDPLIEAVGLPRHLFSSVLRAGTVVGAVHSNAEKDTLIPAGTPVVIAGADTHCGTLGSGAIHAGDIAAIAGTSTPVQLITSHPLLDEKARTWSGPHVVPGQWVIESNAGITGSWLRWFRDTFCHEEAAAARRQKRSVFDLMVELASRAPAGSMGVFALLGAAEMNARRLQSTTAGFGGFVMSSPRALLTMPDSKGCLIRAIFETFAYSNRANIEQLGAITQKQWDRVYLCGGMAVCSFWAQMAADVMNREVVVPHIVEGTSIGAAICAGVGVGIYPDFATAAARLIRSSRVFKPCSEAVARYEPLYKNWKYLTGEVRTLQPKDEMTQAPEPAAASR